jgi:hypothetical protein
MTRFADLPTPGGYLSGEVASALQKSIRRGLEREALHWATELAGYSEHPLVEVVQRLARPAKPVRRAIVPRRAAAKGFPKGATMPPWVRRPPRHGHCATAPRRRGGCAHQRR